MLFNIAQSLRTVVGAGGESGIIPIQNWVVDFANTMIGILAAVSVFYMIKSGWEWINGGEKNQAQQTMINAAIGVIVALLAFIIVQYFVGAAILVENTVR